MSPIPSDLTGTREEDAAREARDIAAEAATYADADPPLGPDEHEAALETEAAGLDAIAREEAETLPPPASLQAEALDPLAAIGFNVAAQDVLQAVAGIERVPVEAFERIVEVMRQQTVRAQAENADPETLSQLDQQAAVLEATRRFRKDLVKVGESIQARRRLQGLQ